MQKKKVFIDGGHGTTGLLIIDVLNKHSGVELISIADEERKNPQAKSSIASQADLVILCLPDEAAIEAVKLYQPYQQTKIIDASTAHRTSPDWVYGLAELEHDWRRKIAGARLIANPGCYPIGMILLLRPLIMNKAIPSSFPVTVFGVSGYTGGGKNMVEQYQSMHETGAMEGAFTPYSLTSPHKHLPEIKQFTCLENEPLFLPSVADADRGMLDIIPMPGKADEYDKIEEILQSEYANEIFIRFSSSKSSDAHTGKLSLTANRGGNFVDLYLFKNNNDLILTACYDNLGKGAAYNAVQNLNIAFGFPEHEGIPNAQT